MCFAKRGCEVLSERNARNFATVYTDIGNQCIGAKVNRASSL